MNKNNVKIKVGVLFDSINKNTGDAAMGLVMGDFLDSINVKYKILSPLKNESYRYSLIISGGGQIIRKPGDEFYDNFRIWGEHILNAADFTNYKELGFLIKYRYISVRTTRSKNELAKIGLAASVVPDICISMKNKSTGPDIPQGAVGVHLMPTIFKDELVRQIKVIKEISKINKVVLIPITHYAGDYKYLKKIQRQIPGTILLNEMGPQSVFDTIGKFKMLITMSLHGAIFAYSQKIDFIVWDEPLNRKMYEFLKDRKLEGRLFKNANQIFSKYTKYSSKKIDYSKQLAKDRMNLQEHFKKMEEIIKGVDAEAPVDDLYLSVNQLEAQRNSLTRSDAEYKAKLKIKNAQIMILNKEINQIKETKSWKIVKKINKYKNLFK